MTYIFLILVPFLYQLVLGVRAAGSKRLSTIGIDLSYNVN